MRLLIQLKFSQMIVLLVFPYHWPKRFRLTVSRVLYTNQFYLLLSLGSIAYCETKRSKEKKAYSTLLSNNKKQQQKLIKTKRLLA